MFTSLLMQAQFSEMEVNRRSLMATSHLARLVALEAWKKDVLDVVFDYHDNPVVEAFLKDFNQVMKAEIAQSVEDQIVKVNGRLNGI